MRRRRMGGISLSDPRHTTTTTKDHHHHHAPVVEDIGGLIKVYKDGHVERFPIIRDVPCTWSLDPGVAAADVVIDQTSRLWARLYVPVRHPAPKLPLLVYFHGGGFSVGSAAWSCYHEFCSRLAAKAGCVILSVNYRLAPEHRLPAAFDDGLKTMKWVRRQASRNGDLNSSSSSSSSWWSSRCDFSRIFLSGDSAGATIAHNVAVQLSSLGLPATLKGVILIQPFFGGESRTPSEKNMAQPPSSALTLAVSDTYWRLALPAGASRDHQYCNPLARGRLEDKRLPPFLVCIAENDIMIDREMEFCRAMRRAGQNVEQEVHGGVGHAFQVLNSSRLAQARAEEMVQQIKGFMNR